MTGEFVPGEVITADGTITLNEGRETAEVTVGNTGDRPIQVGSHFHFFEANAALSFDREAAYGMRLNIPAGTAVRFEPGDQTSVELVAIGGKRRAHGMNGMVNGSVDTDPSAAVERLRAAGFADTGAPDDEHGTAEGSSE
ncbi:urease subunit beta [Haloferax volcanii]|uniref:Urease subunit beta n=3 Tax=Haloferax volcanii TaxID=2246 RepID=D4GZ91_HALVD|nr:MULTISPECIES: urease subunit beta [Haloferax]ADE02537.1 urease beta subunit [Haloferax volcanii DS2]ELY24362.1 urease subunit beta [Haloferax volcanii DS2]MBS8118681.1 urease subunit beta [Haloferax volcanii]MBS8123695.1 urease subunit beta [Haloferax volcanii]MBS8127564.1 urease subunit beta [Haloferax volcanii]